MERYYILNIIHTVLACYQQVTVYLGKRDFVDHVTEQEPIGIQYVAMAMLIYQSSFRWSGAD